jgi:hypothetical protein
MNKDNYVAECMECHRLCMEAVSYCLRQGGDYAEENHIKLLLNCSQICMTAVDFMIRGCESLQQVCEITAYLCERTVVSCQRWAETDAVLKQCMNQCSRCGEHNRKVMMAAA